VQKDTVFNREMNVVFSNTPMLTERRLRAKHPDTWAYVCIGETRQIVTVSEYVNREKFAAIGKVVEEILERQAKRPLKGHAQKLYADRMTKKIIDLI